MLMLSMSLVTLHANVFSSFAGPTWRCEGALSEQILSPLAVLDFIPFSSSGILGSPFPFLLFPFPLPFLVLWRVWITPSALDGLEAGALREVREAGRGSRKKTIDGSVRNSFNSASKGTLPSGCFFRVSIFSKPYPGLLVCLDQLFHCHW